MEFVQIWAEMMEWLQRAARDSTIKERSNAYKIAYGKMEELEELVEAKDND